MDYETDDYKVRLLGQVTVVRLKHANFTGVLDVNRVSDELKGMIDNGLRKLVVDFKHVQHCGSAGLGMLLGLHHKMKEEGGRMVISHPETIAELLRISRTSSLFKTAADPREAVKLF